MSPETQPRAAVVAQLPQTLKSCSRNKKRLSSECAGRPPDRPWAPRRVDECEHRVCVRRHLAGAPVARHPGNPQLLVDHPRDGPQGAGGADDQPRQVGAEVRSQQAAGLSLIKPLDHCRDTELCGALSLA